MQYFLFVNMKIYENIYFLYIVPEVFNIVFVFLKIFQNGKNFTAHTEIYVDLYEYVFV